MVDLRTSYRHDCDGGRLPEGTAMIIASESGTAVGTLSWDYFSEPPVVVGIDVDANFQRQGIATAMWTEALSRESKLVHSSTLTDDGRDWIDSLT